MPLTANQPVRLRSADGKTTLERSVGQVSLRQLCANPAARKPWLIVRRQGAVKRIIGGAYRKRYALFLFQQECGD